LAQLTTFVCKSGAESFVAGHHLVERAPEHKLIEGAVPAEGERHIERWISAGLQLIEQPKTALRRSRWKIENAFIRPGRIRTAVHLGLG
jgi:hypothetical protein